MEKQLIVEDSLWSPQIEKLLWGDHIASQYSLSTRDRWLRNVDKKKYLGAAESRFYRNALRLILYIQEERDRCIDAQAHFAVGILSVSLIECFLMMKFLSHKKTVSSTKTFEKLCRYYAKRGERKPAFLKVVSSMKADALYRIAREMDLLSLRDLPSDICEVMKLYKYPADVAGVFKFLQTSRNNLHSANASPRIHSMLIESSVDPRGTLHDYHYNFAFVALNIQRALNASNEQSGLLVRPF